MTDPHKTLHSAVVMHRDLVAGTCSELDELAGAASMLGMERMSDRLTALCDNLLASINSLNSAHSNAVYERFRESEQATANMVNAAIAAASVAPGKSDGGQGDR